MIDPLIKIVKRRLGDRVEVLYNIDDLKASTDNIETALTIHNIAKTNAASVGMVVNKILVLTIQERPKIRFEDLN